MKMLIFSILFFCYPLTAHSTTAKVEISINSYPHCQKLVGKVSTTQDASSDFQNCLNSLPEGAILSLPSGIYKISGNIRFDKTVHINTRGIASGSSRCQLNGVNRCATFQYSFIESKVNTNPSYVITAKHVSFDHLIFSGAKSGSTRNKNCNAPGKIYNSKGGTIRAKAENFTMTNSVLKDLPCYTALEVADGAYNFIFRNNLVANNGTHTTQGFWADGVTVHDNKNAVVMGNVFENNTDVDLIFGGCQNCTVKNNVIRHTGSRAGSSFAAFMIYSWEKTSGNFIGSIFEHNQIDCGSLKACGYGLYIGGAAWRPARVRGANVRFNKISNAMVALAVDGLTGTTNINSNTIVKSGGVFHGRCIGTRYVNPINVERSSRAHITGDLFSLPNDMFSGETYTAGCIYNFFNENPLAQNFEFLLTQLYHGFLDRDVESTAILNNWKNYYNRNGLVALVRAIGNSPEANRLNTTTSDKVTAAYLAILRRHPESQNTIEFWSRYNRSQGQNKMLEMLTTSPESRSVNSHY